METPTTLDGLSSVPTGAETPSIIDLRKRASGLETPDTAYSRELYTVIQEKSVQGGMTGQLFGSDRTYALPHNSTNESGLNKSDSSHPSRSSQGQGADEDNNVDEEETGKRKRKLDASNITKKYKDFKF